MSHRIEQAGLRWRRYRPKRRVFREPLNLLALINVATVFGAFLLLNADFVLQPGVLLQLPAAAFVTGARYSDTVITITQEGQTFFNDERMPLEAVGQALAQVAERNPAVTLTIEADYRVPYGAIVRVVNLATAIGIHQVNLATRPGFGEEIMP